MDWVTLKLAEWLPDQPDFENTGATTAKNCYAGATSYKPIKALAVYSAATGTSTADYIRGAISIKDSTNIARIYAGDAGKLYNLSATTWDDISIAGAYSGTATQERWNFCQFGSDILIATNYNNNIQKIIPGSAAVVLGGSPPRARYCAQIRDWVVLGYLNDGAVRANRIKWCGYNNAELWTRDVSAQSDQQDLYEGGHITGLVEVAGTGLVLQEEAIQLMQYAGPPITWSFNKIATGAGTKAPGSVCTYRERVWWIGESDIWEFSGGQITPIGAEKIARTFFADYDATYNYRITSAVDPVNNLVAWAYPGVGHINGLPNRTLIYAFNVGRFTILEESIECLFRFMSPGFTLDSLDSLSGSLDALSSSLDDPAYKGGLLNFAAFNASKKLATFTGTPYTGVMETAELRIQPGSHTEITNIRPLYEGGAAKIRVGSRASQSDGVTWGSQKLVNGSGECNVRVNSRFTRARLELSGNWSHAIGVDVRTRSGNKR